MRNIVVPRMRGRVYELLVSAGVVAILGAQFTTLLATALLKPVGEWFWPISDYPMYASPGYEGDRVDSENLLFVVLDDARIRAISRQELGVSVFRYSYLTSNMVRRPTPVGAAPLLTLLKERGLLKDGARIREIVVKSSGRVITREGVSQQAPKELARILIDRSDP